MISDSYILINGSLIGEFFNEKRKIHHCSFYGSFEEFQIHDDGLRKWVITPGSPSQKIHISFDESVKLPDAQKGDVFRFMGDAVSGDALFSIFPPKFVKETFDFNFTNEVIKLKDSFVTKILQNKNEIP